MQLPEYSILELQEKFDTKELSAKCLCEQYLKRISEIDRKGPTLRSVLELNPDVLGIASNLDEERRKKGPRSILHGIPVLLKDLIDTGDRMMTTAGSLALEGNYAPKDAFLVQKLREAGAVILGKANLSEWGYIRSTRPCSGWSSLGGQVLNPYVLDRSPLGSSSGSAVAVAANLCMVAIGTEVDGSIVRPSSSNCIVGLKPTVGLVSRTGIFGLAYQQYTAGPMARSVADLAALLTVIAAGDSQDPLTLQNGGNHIQDYCKFLDLGALKGARLGIARECFGNHEGTDSVIENAISRLKSLGAEIVDPVRASTLPFFGTQEVDLFKYGLKKNLNKYLEEHPKAKVRSLKELIRFNEDHADLIMPYFKQEFFEMAQANTISDEDYRKIEEECRRLALTEGIDKAMKDNKLDAIIAPTEGSPPFVIDPIVGDHILKGGCSTPPALAGYPHITVPAGYVHGLPVGLSFFGRAYDDGRLISYAYAFEQATKVRRPPGYLPTIRS